MPPHFPGEETRPHGVHTYQSPRLPWQHRNHLQSGGERTPNREKTRVPFARDLACGGGLRHGQTREQQVADGEGRALGDLQRRENQFLPERDESRGAGGCDGQPAEGALQERRGLGRGWSSRLGVGSATGCPLSLQVSPLFFGGGSPPGNDSWRSGTDTPWRWALPHTSQELRALG